MNRTSKQFYTELQPDGLAAWKNVSHTKSELAYLKRILNRTQRILDLGCGYGRFTIPLAKCGYKIEGIDITPSLIKKAQEISKKEKLNVRFKIGDMRNLPYADKSFDAILCMWSVFIELSNMTDQIKAIKEMLRVLSDKGFALIEMPIPSNKKISKISDDIRQRKGKIWTGKISGFEAMPHYAHNRRTLKELMKKAKIRTYKIFTDEFGGRERLFLQIKKQAITQSKSSHSPNRY